MNSEGFLESFEVSYDQVLFDKGILNSQNTNYGSQDAYTVAMVHIPGEKRPMVLWTHYSKRTTQKEPKMIGPDTLRCNASMLEADGVKNIFKKINHPSNKMEIGSWVSDGDQKSQNIMNTLKWNEDDDVPRPMVGQLVVENTPTHYQG